MTTPEEFRLRFPALTETTYLASCSQGALSDMLATALLEFQHTLLEYGAPWEQWLEQVDLARQLFADMIHATTDEIAVVPSLSAAAYQVASTRDWRSRPRIVTTDMEFPSVAHVWLAQRGTDVRYVEDRSGVVYAEDYDAAIDETCGLVSVPLISYRNGVRLPVESVLEKARSVGALTFVDAYQAAGVVPIDVRQLGCDFLAAGSLKYMLGIPGIAFLYVREGVQDAVDPQATGWFGRRDPFAFNPRVIDFPANARRFESGTPAIPAAYGAVAGMRVLASLEPKAIQGHIAELTEYAHSVLDDLGTPSDPSLRDPQVALIDPNPNELAEFLRARNIVTSPRGELLRISFHYYNTSDDVDAVAAAIREYRK
ncbi:aminotransferase class V-fold PLP-dependent enzyme [Kibdelosporangium philippinense]|uniref:Aminotransferase class V-fold PLP-dependent enzyme n=1 Tax=Kibdelosporangium philippinense TaxID=211113 RepID=A0ABS8ZM98_9PSEU|nr:aminotransferase class V-fold PLP-dependent enzyme [Kibdelosporangium philippinense]MCE7008879.1 aminotransferase class V-fold PLP-dependent enzyme [Kibdelosporangium philippinense]